MAPSRTHAQEVATYAKGYTDRHVILRLLLTTNDRDFHEEKVQQLSELIADATFSITVATHTLVGDVAAEVKAMAEQMRQQTPYVVRRGEGGHTRVSAACARCPALRAMRVAVPMCATRCLTRAGPLA